MGITQLRRLSGTWIQIAGAQLHWWANRRWWKSPAIRGKSSAPLFKIRAGVTQMAGKGRTDQLPDSSRAANARRECLWTQHQGHGISIRIRGIGSQKASIKTQSANPSCCGGREIQNRKCRMIASTSTLCDDGKSFDWSKDQRRWLGSAYTPTSASGWSASMSSKGCREYKGKLKIQSKSGAKI